MTAAVMTEPSTGPDLSDLSIANEDFRILRIDRRGITVCGESHKWMGVESLTDLVDTLVDTDSGSANALTTAQFLRRLAVLDGSAAAHITTGDYEITLDRRLRGVVGTWVKFGFSRRGIVRVPTMVDLEGHRISVVRNDGSRYTVRCSNPESHGDGWVAYLVDAVLDSVE